MGKSIEIDGVRHKAPIPMAASIGPLLYTSAVMGADPATGKEPPDAARQIGLAFANLAEVLRQASFSTEDVIRVDVLLARDELRELVNQNWIRMFPDEHDRPARHTTLVTFRGDRLVQLEAVCFRPDTS